jgi:zinc protease
MTDAPLRLSLIAAFGVLVALATPARAELFNPETFTLENGLQVVVVPNHLAPVVTHMVWYKVGAADEPAGKSGIAHFLEHLMFKGTEKVPPGEFSKIVAGNGGRDNAFTSQDYTSYFQRVARDRLELVMELEADRMANLKITAAEVVPEREVVLEERRSRTENQPASLLGEAMQAALYMNHPYREPIIGWNHEIRELTTEDALDFYRRYYAPNNAILIVGGDITGEELRPLAERHYGGIPPRDVPARVRPQEPVQHAARRVVLTSPLVGQPSWVRRYLAPSYTAGDTEHAHALVVLADLFGHDSSSRLHRALVVDGEIAVSAAAGYDSESFDLTDFSIHASPRPGVELARIEAAVEAEVAKLLEDGVTEEEVARAKRRLRAATIYSRDSMFAAARIFGVALTTGRTIEDVESWLERVEAVTVDQVNRAARAVLRKDRWVTGELLPPPSS